MYKIRHLHKYYFYKPFHFHQIEKEKYYLIFSDGLYVHIFDTEVTDRELYNKKSNSETTTVQTLTRKQTEIR